MTSRVPHLLTYISGHGYGHIAQTGPVLDRLRQLVPELRVTVCSTAPIAQLQSRIGVDFTHISQAADFGMTMASALDVMIEESMQAYQTFHSDWPDKVAREASRIAQIAPDFVFSNVAYLPLAAARKAGVPCAAMCSLNWIDIFSHYCGRMPGAEKILDQMRDGYYSADAFLRVTPGMPMADLPNLRSIGPISRTGTNRRQQIDRLLNLEGDEKLVLVSLGGIAMRLPMESWPKVEGVRWLVQADWQVSRADTVTLESLAMDFTEVLASCDALVCKPGYGSFTEAACNGVPVLYVSRHDWPEEACLVEWLAEYGRCVEVGRAQLEAGQIGEALSRLWRQPHPAQVTPTGIEEAADYLFRSISMASP
jgi:UDP:flavonoid glycosyltransferase YjiC (YdhE family)